MREVQPGSESAVRGNAAAAPNPLQAFAADGFRGFRGAAVQIRGRWLRSLSLETAFRAQRWRACPGVTGMFVAGQNDDLNAVESGFIDPLARSR